MREKENFFFKWERERKSGRQGKEKKMGEREEQ
jgi:hypothetical protein